MDVKTKEGSDYKNCIYSLITVPISILLNKFMRNIHSVTGAHLTLFRFPYDLQIKKLRAY